MKKYTSIITFFFGLISIQVVSQKQISDIQNLEVQVEFPFNGFLYYDNVEYFIQRNQKQTRVSKIVNDETVHLYDIEQKPTDDRIFYFSFSSKSNNSYIIHKDNLYFELYRHNVFIFDIVTGKLIHRIDLSEYNLNLRRGIEYTDNHVLFRCNDLGSNSQYSYSLDLRNFNFRKLDFTGGAIAYNIDNYVYWSDKNNNQLKRYDLETNEISVIHQAASAITISNTTYHNNRPTIYFRDSDKNYFYIASDHKKHEIPCIDSESEIIGSIYIRDSFLIYEIVSNRILLLRIKDTNSCNVIGTGPFLADASAFIHTTNFVDSYELEPNQVLISNLINDFEKGNFFLIELSSSTVTHNLDIHSGDNAPPKYIRKDDKIYFSKYNRDDQNRNRSTIVSLDLITKEKTEFSDALPDRNIFSRTYLGEDTGSDSFHFYGDHFALKKFNSKNFDRTQLEDFQRSGTSGFSYVESEISHNENYFVATDVGVFHIKNDSTHLVSELNKVYEMHIENDTLFFTGADSSGRGNYAIYSIQDETIESDTLPEIEVYIGNLTYPFFITSSSPMKVFDFRTRSIKELSYQGNTLNSPSAIQFGDQVIINENQSRSKKIYKYDEVNDALVDLDIVVPHGLDVKGKNGNLHFVSYGNTSPMEIISIDKEGEKIGPKIQNNINYYAHFYGSFYDEEISEDSDFIWFVLRNRDLSDVYIVRDSAQFDIYSIPHEWPSDIYSGQVLISDSLNVVNFGNNIYYFGENSPPIEIFEHNYDKLMKAIVEDEQIILFLYDESSDRFDIYSYDFEANKITLKNSVSTSRYSFVTYNASYLETEKLDGNNYAIIYDNGLLGSELYTFDSETYQFSLHSDMNPGHVGSELRDMVKVKENIYFSGEIDNNRQWYRWVQKAVSTKEIESKNTERTQLVISPNPSNNQIRLNDDYDCVEIFNVKGQLILRLNSYTKNDRIDIRNHLAGTYLLRVVKNNKYNTELFLKQG